MKSRVLVSAAVAIAALMGVSGEAFAKDGNKKSLLIGGAAGLAVGAVGATLYNRSQQPAQPQRQDYTGSTARPVSYQAAQSCSTRPVKLFDESGTYVKTERMRVCN